MAKVNLSNAYTKVNKASDTRRNNDFYPTPPIATFALAQNIALPMLILEPCAGRGHISVELIRLGHRVLSEDLFAYEDSKALISTGKNFLDRPSPGLSVGIITNPPYEKDFPRKMALHAIKSSNFTAFLVRISFLEGKKRKALFDEFPPTHIFVFSDRLNFISTDPFERHEQIGGMMSYAWFIWDHRKPLAARGRKTQFKWLLLEKIYDDWAKSMGLVE